MASATERREALKELLMEARACTRCAELAATRTSVVFGAGNADADLMFVGEAPGANEDLQGLPFVGAAGKLLETLLGEIGLSRAEVFIANVLKCRPPGNRDPRPGEIENCTPYLVRQVELVSPRVICTLGNFATKLLRGDPAGISRVHGRPALEHVRDEHLRAAEADLAEQRLEQLAGGAHERQPLQVLVGTGRLADEHQVGVGIARAEDDGGPGGGEIRAPRARARRHQQLLERLAPFGRARHRTQA